MLAKCLWCHVVFSDVIRFLGFLTANQIVVRCAYAADGDYEVAKSAASWLDVQVICGAWTQLVVRACVYSAMNRILREPTITVEVC